MLTEETIIELSFLTHEAAVPTVDDLSLRLSRHHTSAIRRQKVHGVDIITVQVEGSGVCPLRLASLVASPFADRKRGG